MLAVIGPNRWLMSPCAFRKVVIGFALAARISAAEAGPPYLTDDPEPPPLGHWEAVLFTMGLEAGDAAAGALPAMEFNYGGFPDTQLHIMLPLGFTTGGGGARFGGADVELGVKYRFIEEDDQGWRPQLAAYPFVEVPTESSRNSLASPGVDVFLPLWAQKDLGANWTVDAGGGYWINPGARNYWFAGALLQRKITDALVAGIEAFHQSPVDFGTSAITGFNIGATYDFNEHDHLLLSAGRGIVNANVSDQLTWYVGYEITE